MEAAKNSFSFELELVGRAKTGFATDVEFRKEICKTN
jgi:hypothetical protein